MPSAMLLPNILIHPLGQTRLAENADYTLGGFTCFARHFSQCI
jgi:hypothetical protein